ncbi:hypothetical protein Drorol1_Dr00021968 [Drosera rotundifolia]
MFSNDQTLCLSLGFTPAPRLTATNEHRHHQTISTPFEPTLSLSLRNNMSNATDHDESSKRMLFSDVSGSRDDLSPMSSFSVKRERESGEEGEADAERSCSQEEDGGNRKKLRLSKQQSALLEESFKLQSTLNPKQKQALAQRLNLRPRQVEVWFQNRRARTKLKKTEVDCSYWKRYCETLTCENKKLQKELQELRALKTAHPAPFYMPATLTMCPKCEKIGGSNGVVSAKMKATTLVSSPSTVNAKSLLFFNPFAKPSAAC